MKKLIGAIAGCIAVYYVIDVLAVVSTVSAWYDLLEYGHGQAAHELDDTFHKKYCNRNRKVFDAFKRVLFESMKKERN